MAVEVVTLFDLRVNGEAVAEDFADIVGKFQSLSAGSEIRIGNLTKKEAKLLTAAVIFALLVL